MKWSCWHHLPDLNCKLRQIAAECEADELRVSISKSDSTTLASCSKTVDCSLSNPSLVESLLEGIQCCTQLYTQKVTGIQSLREELRKSFHLALGSEYEETTLSGRIFYISSTHYGRGRFTSWFTSCKSSRWRCCRCFIFSYSFSWSSDSTPLHTLGSPRPRGMWLGRKTCGLHFGSIVPLGSIVLNLVRSRLAVHLAHNTNWKSNWKWDET